MSYTDIRDQLREIIIERGYKQVSIAKKAKLSPSKLSAILNKARKLDVNEMFSICEAAGIDPQELMNSAKRVG